MEQGPAATVEVVKRLIGDEPAPAGGASTDVTDKPESSKVEQEIEAGKTSAQEVETAPAEAEQSSEAPVANGGESTMEDKAHAETAAQVADSAQKLDGTPVPA